MYVGFVESVLAGSSIYKLIWNVCIVTTKIIFAHIVNELSTTVAIYVSILKQFIVERKDFHVLHAKSYSKVTMPWKLTRELFTVKMKVVPRIGIIRLMKKENRKF